MKLLKGKNDFGISFLRAVQSSFSQRSGLKVFASFQYFSFVIDSVKFGIMTVFSGSRYPPILTGLDVQCDTPIGTNSKR